MALKCSSSTTRPVGLAPSPLAKMVSAKRLPLDECGATSRPGGVAAVAAVFSNGTSVDIGHLLRQVVVLLSSRTQLHARVRKGTVENLSNGAGAVENRPLGLPVVLHIRDEKNAL